MEVQRSVEQEDLAITCVCYTTSIMFSEFQRLEVREGEDNR